jgi:hypothetical protein
VFPLVSEHVSEHKLTAVMRLKDLADADFPFFEREKPTVPLRV